MVAQEEIVESKLLNKAINALLKHHKSQAKSSDKTQLLGNDQSIHVQFNLTRIPQQTSLSSRPIRIEIPNSLNKLNSSDDGDNENLEEAEVCLIVKDSSKKWVQELISQFPKELSYVKKVLSLTSLRKKYAQYQDKRSLCNMYTLFLVDDCILPMVGKLLGKSFFMKKKQPVPVKLSRKESLPFAIENCIRSTFLVIGAGTCLSVKAAGTTMSSKSIEQNIQSVIQNAIPHVPRKAANISSISIKTDSSVALPIYNKIREELDIIEKLAKVEKTNISTGSSSNDKLSKKRVLDNDEEEEKKKQKTKKDDALKSPLLKALKKTKMKEKAVEEVKRATKDNKKKKKKRRSSEVDLVDDSPAKEIKKEKLIEKKKKITKAETSVDDKGKKDKNTDFMPSKKFQGAKKGYVFRKDKKGVGYYIDLKPVPDKMALEALARSNKNSGGKSRRQSTGKMQRGRKGRRSSY